MLIQEILTELVGVKQTLAANDYKTVLTDQGFSPLGSGSFATVWAHPKLDYVLKTFNANDSSYRAWLSVCFANQNNPSFPRIISRQLVPVVPGVVAVRLEKLAELSGPAERVVTEAGYFIDECTIDTEQPPQTFRGMQLRFSKLKTSYPAFFEYARAHRGVLVAVWNIIELINHGPGVNDLGEGNVMMRGNELVFTDPV